MKTNNYEKTIYAWLTICHCNIILIGKIILEFQIIFYFCIEKRFFSTENLLLQKKFDRIDCNQIYFMHFSFLFGIFHKVLMLNFIILFGGLMLLVKINQLCIIYNVIYLINIYRYI